VLITLLITTLLALYVIEKLSVSAPSASIEER